MILPPRRTWLALSWWCLALLASLALLRAEWHVAAQRPRFDLGDAAAAEAQRAWADVPLSREAPYCDFHVETGCRYRLHVSAGGPPTARVLIRATTTPAPAAAPAMLQWRALHAPTVAAPARYGRVAVEAHRSSTPNSGSSPLPAGALARAATDQSACGGASGSAVVQHIEDSVAKGRIIHVPGGGLPWERAAWRPTRCREVVRGRRCRLLWDEAAAISPAGPAWAEQVVRLMEQRVLPAVEARLGSCADVDGDGFLTLVVTPSLQALGGGDPPLEAIVRAADFRDDLAPPFSNQADLIYLAPEIRESRLAAILTHETTHAAQFSALRRRCGGGAEWELADWLLEGLAHAAECELAGATENIRDRVRACLDCPERSPLVVPDELAAGLWRCPRSRGAQCLFFDWCTRRHGSEWWREWPEFHTGEDAGWARVLGAPLRELQRAWMLDLDAYGTELADDASQSSAERRHPRRIALLSGETCELALDGTGTAIFALEFPAHGVQRLRLTSEPPAELHVTLVRERLGGEQP